MADIKTKNKAKYIKILDKTAALRNNIKIIQTKTKQDTNNSPTNQATDAITTKTKELCDTAAYKANEYGRNSTYKVYNNIKSFRNIRKLQNTASSSIKATNKMDKTTKTGSRGTIKTAEKSFKTTAKTVQTTINASKKAAQNVKATGKAIATTTKAIVKATIIAVKSTVSAIKDLISVIAAGGWLAVIVIVLICLFALIAGSSFGIFFSNEDVKNSIPVNQVIAQINNEYQSKIDEIKNTNDYDVLEMSGSRAVWKDVLAVYAVKVMDNNVDSITMTDEKKSILRQVFWDMNKLTYSTQTVKKGYSTTTVLTISLKSKSATQMAVQYKFNNNQINQLNILLDEKNSSMWNKLLCGIKL